MDLITIFQFLGDVFVQYSIQILLAVIAILLLIIAIQFGRIANSTRLIMLNTKNQDISFNKLNEHCDNINGILSQMQSQQGNNNDNWGVRPE